MLQDLRLALRAVRRDPGVYGVAALSLALGVAALTTAWATLDVLLFRPYPYDPDGSLVLVGTGTERGGTPGSPSSIPDFVDLRARARSMRVAAYRDEGANLGANPATWVAVRRASAEFFDVVGVAPRLGRAFTAADEEAGSADVALLGHGLWERRFGADEGVLGRTVLVDGAPVAVVGVLPAGFRFNRGAPELWLPLRITGTESRAARPVYVFGRLDGGPLAGARSELASLARAFAEEHPDTWSHRSFVSGPLRETLTGSATLQQGGAALVLASLAVLLIACANVANLLLARATMRRGDLVLRRALGAGGWRIARQALSEAMVLATAAGLLAIALAVAGMRGFAALLPPELPRAGESVLDARSGALAMLAAIGSVVAFSLAPILRSLAASRRALPSRGHGPGAAGPERGRLRSTLVAAEVALALALVATTTLVVRSLSAIRALETGFDVEDVVAFDLTLPERTYGNAEAMESAAARLGEAIVTTPGVVAGGVGVGLPGRDWRSLPYGLPDPSSDEDPDATTVVATRYATPGYLAALGVDVVRGRSLTAEDDARSAPVALVNRRFAERLWPDTDPVGRTLVLGGRTVEVVGVTPDLSELGPFGATAFVYLPLAQWPSPTLSVVARAPFGVRDGHALARDIAGRVDPALAPHGVAAMEDVLLLPADRTAALGKVLGVLSAVALALALVGVFGSMAYAVACRVPEIGIRMALGAPPQRIRAMVLRGAAGVCALGLAVGTVLAVLAARGVTAFLFGVGAADPATFLGSAALLLAVGLAAAWVPARRAMLVDPMTTLRRE